MGPECTRGQYILISLMMRCRAVSDFIHSPKPGLPSPSAYEPPPPPTQRELGPPPPGYGRYADFDRSGGGSLGPGGGGSGGPPGPRRNLEDVECFKVNLPQLFSVVGRVS